jgi:hypothetical protein
MSPADVVGAARSTAGALGAVANNVIATAIEVFTSDGVADGLGCAIAGGFAVLSKLSVAHRRAAVTAARSAAGALGAVANNVIATAIEVFTSAVVADGLGCAIADVRGALEALGRT